MIIHNQQLLPTFNKTITLVNKLAAKDSVTKKDVWYVNTIDNCAVTNTIVRNVQGAVVSLGRTFVVRIPYSGKYKNYMQWQHDIENSFTINVGDYVFLNELTDEDIITPNTILNIYNKYRDSSFVIKTFRDNSNQINQLRHYHIEGF